MIQKLKQIIQKSKPLVRKLRPWLLIVIIYGLIFVQYPLGEGIFRLVAHKDIITSMQPSYLLLWGAVRIGLVLPLLYYLVTGEGHDRKDIYLRFGNFSKVILFTFWSTFGFTILGLVLYSWFLNSTNLSLILFLEYAPIFIIYAIANAFVEESFFRGAAISFLTEKMSPMLANLIQAIFFAAIHITSPMASNLWLFVFLTFILGLIWGSMTNKYKSLLPAIVLHVVADIFVAVSLF